MIRLTELRAILKKNKIRGYSSMYKDAKTFSQQSRLISAHDIKV